MSLINRIEKNKKEITVSMEEITPHKAAEYLASNTQNRRLSAGHVAILAHDMSSGAWEINGDAIRFDTEGTLIDGQHRLNAIIKADTSIQCFVMRNLPADAFATIDTNKVRGGADTLSVLGEEHHIVTASALRLVAISGLSEDWNGWSSLGGGRTKITNKDIIELSRKYPGVSVAASRTAMGDRKMCRKLLTPSVAAFVFYWLSSIDDVDAEQFFSWIEDGANLDKEHPVIMLRNRLIEMAASHSGRGQVAKRTMLALTFRAWNALRDNEGIKLLRWSTTTKFPTPH